MADGTIQGGLETDGYPVDLPLAEDFKALHLKHAKEPLFKEKCDSGYDSGNLPSDMSDSRLGGLGSDFGLCPLSENCDEKIDLCVSNDSAVCLSGNTYIYGERFRQEREESNVTRLPEPAFNEEIVQQDEDGDTQIHLAIIQLLQVVALCLIQQVPSHKYLNIQNNYHQTPLHLAVLTKQAVIARRLVCGGASVEIRDYHGNTPLHIAAKNGYTLIAQILLEPVQHEETLDNQYEIQNQTIPQNMETRNYDGQMCIHLAAEENNFDVLEVLLAKGADINARDGKSGRTILHYAAESRNLQLLKFLLKHIDILNINAVTYGGLTAIKLAQGRGNSDVVRILQQAGAEPVPEESSSEEEDMDEDFNDIHINGVHIGATR